MTPYASFFYFGLLLYPLAIGLILAWLGKLTPGILLGLTCVMLLVQYSRIQAEGPGALDKVWAVTGFALFQLAVASGFLRVRQRLQSKAAFWGAVILGLLPLALVKFAPSTVSVSLLEFAGLSYVTFRSLDVIIGIEDRLITALSSQQYLLFLLFFPTISSGPIDRFRRFAGDLAQPRTRQALLADIDSGVQHIMRGFAYKFLVAALIKSHWLEPAETGHGIWSTLSYMYAYTLYLFFDFAGYSAFAIGVGAMLGIRTPENFRLPFLARNINDFWNRWHISLSTWFRDHVFMRFLLAATRGKWFQSREVASVAAFYVTFLLMGLWHGVALRYVVYGLYHATLLSIHNAFARWRRKQGRGEAGLGWQVASTALTFQLVCFGLLIFSGRLG
jgi:membrane protein involved in D-alanine export